VSRDIIIDKSIKYNKDYIPTSIKELESITIIINNINNTKI
jgi:hypothetical protein